MNYRQNFKNYFGKIDNKKNLIKDTDFYFSKIQKKKINKFIKDFKIYKNFDELINFIKKSIKYREYSKFIFTKSIDSAFENMEKFGRKFNISKDQMSYLNVNSLLDLYFNYSNMKPIDKLKKEIFF